MDRLKNYGMRSEKTNQRLARLQSVENTYLSIFQALGGLGLLLGTFGLVIVVIRNLWERRREQALFFVMGYSLSDLRTIAWRENVRVVAWGSGIGICCAVLCLLPAKFAGLGNLSFDKIFLFGLLLFVLSVLSISIAIFLGLKDSQVHLLRND